MRRWLAASIALAFAPGPLWAECALPRPANLGSAKPRPITSEDLVGLRDIGGFDSSLTELPSPLALSPDKRRLSFILSSADPTTNGYCRLLIVQDLAAGAPPRVVDSGGDLITLQYAIRGYIAKVGYPDAVTPGWSADGTRIVYLRRDRDVTQLWIASADGAGARALTQSAVDVEAWAWAGTGSVVFATRPAQHQESFSIEREGRSGWIYDERFSPSYGRQPQIRGGLPRVYRVLDTHSGSSRDATPGETALVEPPRSAGVPVTERVKSAYGDEAWLEAETESPLSPERIRMRHRSGITSPCDDVSCADGIVKIFWSGDGRRILYLRREGWAKGSMALYGWTPGRVPRRLWITDDVLLGCLSDGEHLICLREGSTRPRRLVQIEPATGRTRTIFEPNPEFRNLALGHVRRLRWKNDRGLPAWGDLVLPPGSRRGERLPLVVVQYHSDGFLRGGTGDEYPILPLAARGFAVLSIERPAHIATILPNVRTSLDMNRLASEGWAERRSLLSSLLTGVGQVVEAGVADPKRIGITGLSDGASTARFALINSKIFAAAAISQASLEPKTAMTYGGMAWAEYNRALGYPPATVDSPGFWKPFSLALNAAEMETPLLIQAADDEYLLALEAFTALRERHQPVEMYVYPDEHHIKWQPVHRLSVYRRTIDWFDFWLRGRVDPDPAKAEQYSRWEKMRSARPGGDARTTSAPKPPRRAAASAGGGRTP